MISYDVEWYHFLPDHVKEILGTLKNKGKTAYVVGGAVRDLWLGLIPKDFDIVSDASPEEIAGFFGKTLDIGRSFGIMVVVTEKGHVEIARFRSDGAYTDNRRPDEIRFAGPEEDARRRDFTLNALFYDAVNEQVLDYVGGAHDLQARLIRAVGAPLERFREDALRMLRAVRFHAQLAHIGFSLDPSLVDAIRAEAGRLENVSRERVTQELEKLVASASPATGLDDLWRCGLWRPVFQTELPLRGKCEEFDRLLPLFRNTFGTDAPMALFMAAIASRLPSFHPEKSLVLGRDTKAGVKEILSFAERLKSYPALDLAGKKELLAIPQFPSGWVLGNVNGALPPDVMAEVLRQQRAWKQAGSLSPPPLLGGGDLLALGIAPGPEVRHLLEQVRRKQLLEEIHTREEAIGFVRSATAGRAG